MNNKTLTCQLGTETNKGTTYQIIKVEDAIYEKLQQELMGGEEMVIGCDYLDLKETGKLKILKPLAEGYIRLILFRRPEYKKEMVGILSLHCKDLDEEETIIARI